MVREQGLWGIVQKLLVVAVRKKGAEPRNWMRGIESEEQRVDLRKKDKKIRKEIERNNLNIPINVKLWTYQSVEHREEARAKGGVGLESTNIE